MHLVKLGLHITLQQALHAMACSQAFDAIDDPCAVLLCGQEFTMELPTVFLLDAGYTHHTPHLLLACQVAQEHRQEVVNVQPIRLRPAVAPIDLNTRGVDDMVHDALRYQVTVQPEPITPSLVATHDVCVLRQAKALLRPGDLLLESLDITSGDRPFAWLLRDTNSEAQFPGICPSSNARYSVGWGNVSCSMRDIAEV